MKTLCPGCGGSGAHPLSDGGDRCFECLGSGFIEVEFAEGELYTLKCKKCGFKNGGRIVTPERPLPKDGPDIGCPRCWADKTQVEYVKVTDPERN